MTESRHQWHVRHHVALDELLAAFLLANRHKLPSTTTLMEFLTWSYAQVQEPVGEPAVCSHCGDACGEGHVCSGAEERVV